MIFVTGLFVYHTKLVLKNMTTKEDIKNFWENPQGNPFKRRKKLNIKNSLFSQKQKSSLIDIFKKGFINVIPLNDDERSDLPKDLKESENNLMVNNSINNFTFNNQTNEKNNKDNNNNNIRDNKNLSTNLVNKEKNKKDIDDDVDVECSDFTIDEKNHKRNMSCIQSSDINIDLTGEKTIKRKITKKSLGGKDRYSESINNSGGENNIRRSTVRVSDCSENITEASGRKVPYFQTNFDTETHNIEVRPIDNGKLSFNEE